MIGRKPRAVATALRMDDFLVGMRGSGECLPRCKRQCAANRVTGRANLDRGQDLIARQIARLPVTFLKGRNGRERAKECDPRHIAASALPICEPSPRYLSNGIAGYGQ